MAIKLEINSDMLINPCIKQLRVLLVLGTLWGENGITSHVKTLSQQFIKLGFKVAIASDLPSNIEGAYNQALQAVESFRAVGVSYFVMPFAKGPAIFRQPSKVFQTVKALEQIIQTFQPDIVHFHSLSVVPYVHIARIRYQIPFVSTCHLEPDRKNLRSDIKIAAFINQHINHNFLGSRVIAVSSDLQKAYEQIMKVPRENIKLISYGIDEQHFQPATEKERVAARKALNLPPQSKVIAMIGRLSQVKGHDILIRALAILRSQGIDGITLCAGKGYGDEEAVIKNLAIEAGVADLVWLLGLSDTRKVLWASDVIVLPSRREACPLVIQEAMLCGIVPIRTPAAGAFDQIEDGVNGYLIPFEDSQALAMRLKQLLEDEGLRSRMAKAAIESAKQKFTLDQMIQKTITVYKETLTNNK